MSIASELSALQTDITNARTAITTKGGTVTSGGGSSQLATDIATIPTGITPTGNINITTTNQTDVTNYATAQVVDSNLTAGNIKDGVSILGVTGTYTGGSSIGIPREVSGTGVYQMPSSSFTFALPSNATNIGYYALTYAFFQCNALTSVDLSNLTTVSGANAMYHTFDSCRNLAGTLDLSSLTTVSGSNAMNSAFYNCTKLTSVDLSSLTTVSGSNAMNYAFNSCTNLAGTLDLSNLTTVSDASAMYYAFYNCTKLTSVDLSNLTTVSGGNAMNCAFYGCVGITNIDLSSLTTISKSSSLSGFCYGSTALISINFSNLTTIGENNSTSDCAHFSQAFYNCTSLTTISFPKLEKIYCTGNSTASNGTFYNNNKVQKMYFPKLDTITYGSGASSSNQNACKQIFASCSSLTELHFGSANQAAIEASPGYSTAWGRGAGNVTIYFDL